MTPRRVVLDTNILVSALLKAGSLPARVLDLVIGGSIILLLDDRILYEYREVLRRPKFGFEEELVDELLATLDRMGEFIPSTPLYLTIRDPGDLPFLEVAVCGKADALITGNIRDYGQTPPGLKILTVAEFLRELSTKPAD